MRLIDADKLKRVINDYYIVMDHEYVFDAIDLQPTIEAEPVKHGEWINAYPEIEPNPMFMYGICSECGCKQSISSKLKYCFDCGARMDNTVPKYSVGGGGLVIGGQVKDSWD